MGKFNSLKTFLICITDLKTYQAGAFIIDEEGSTIDSGQRMKVLGLNFTYRPDMTSQTEAICQKFRSRIWYLCHLHHNGFSQEELLRVYKTTILPCHDYCSNIFHSSLTMSQTIVLERLQAKALKVIYGYDPSYRELMERANLTTLRASRDERELMFAQKYANSVTFAKWFPRKLACSTMGDRTPYQEPFARCYNSPIFSMRRMFNRSERGLKCGAREGV